MIFGLEAGQFAALVALFFIGTSILVPVLAMSARIALKPVIDALTRLKQNNDHVMLQDRRIDLLQAELHTLNAAVQQLAEVEDFRRQLSASSAPQHPLEHRA